MERKHWSVVTADKVLKQFPSERTHTCAGGISPSGVVHFGNFRDVITAYAAYEELQKRGKNARMIFSWDDFDRFRKVPEGIPASYEKYIGLPLSKVPSPVEGYHSYAECMEQPFEQAMKELGFDITFISQTKKYEEGAYVQQMQFAMEKRKEIADILLRFMTAKGKEKKGIVDKVYREEYYPLVVYSSCTGKDTTKILAYHGGTMLSYKCLETGKEETIDFSKQRIVKLGWKVDWAMRWKYEGVLFEPGGKDHSSEGGSYDVASTIAKEIFNFTPPVYAGYDFVGIQGLSGKMSGSSGDAVSVGALLEIYTPSILKWLYYRVEPLKHFSLAFDSEVLRVYTEFDSTVAKYKAGKLTAYDTKALELSGVKKPLFSFFDTPPIPFRQIVGFGQIVQWNKDKLMQVFRDLGLRYDKKSIIERLERARVWLETYNTENIIQLLDKRNEAFVKGLSAEDKQYVQILRDKIAEKQDMSVKELEVLVYDVVKDGSGVSSKDLAKKQRAFFAVVYQLLIGKDAGPRLSTFLWSIEDKKKLLSLLDVS